MFLAAWLAIVGLFSGAAAAETSGDGHDPPFVAAFDRFARHGELSPQIGGRLLMSELSCTACHAAHDPSLRPKSGPRLAGVGSRLRHGWLVEFLSDPSRAKPGTTMPDLLWGLPETEKQETVRALAAFLESNRADFPEIKAGGASPVPHRFWTKGNVDRGRSLYHSVGCVACHAADPGVEVNRVDSSPVDKLIEQLDPYQLEELGLASAARRVASVPHPEIADKYTRESLTHFLLDPEAVRPSGRMPDLELTPVEAADIAAYLLERNGTTERDDEAAAAKSDGETSSADRLVTRGERLFRQFGCARCHEMPGIEAESRATPLASLDPSGTRHCLDHPQPAQPHYPLSEAQMSAIRRWLGSETSSSEIGVRETLTLRLSQLNCMACHQRDSIGGVGRFRKPYFETIGHVDLGDEGRLPPPLTGVGRKLRDGWMRRVLKGDGDIRPYMRIRMPRFPADVTKPLPEWFAAADRSDSSGSPDRSPSPDGSGSAPFATPDDGDFTGQKLAEAGRRLMDAGCVQCHAFRGYTMPGVVGVDLQGIDRRVRPEWLHAFLLNPAALKPRTRMPTFFPDGESQNAEILGGDTQLQLAAIRRYLKDLERQPLPAKIDEARSRSYELDPDDTPALLRTFMNEAGTHAIAVGFPEDVHFALDAEQVRPAVAWRGRFLDAQGTWFVRFAPPAQPLGDDLIALPAGFPFGWGDASPSAEDGTAAPPSYAGYRLGGDRVPTFLYDWGGFRIEDRIVPDDDHGLTRRLVIRRGGRPGSAEGVVFRALTGTTLTADGPTAYRNDAGLRVEVKSGTVGEGRVREEGGRQTWVLPIPVPAVEDSTSVEVSYQW